MSDRSEPPTFVGGIKPRHGADDRPSRWFLFERQGDRYKLLVEQDGDTARVPLVNGGPHFVGLPQLDSHYLGEHGGVPCYTAMLPDTGERPDGLLSSDLRALYGLLPDEDFWVAGRAMQIVDWDLAHRFCGQCGAATRLSAEERVRTCPSCGRAHFPRLAPAIIVAVTWGDRILLARSHRHPPGRFSVLAGFVEPGESLEECLAREVKEEVGIDVKHIRYFGSQPWPFPHSLMVAFTCEYAGGDLVLDETEMAEADWFTADNLPPIPPPISISRALIDWFVDGRRGS